MPRSSRMIVDGGTYHILTRGNNGQTVFHEQADYQRYLQLLSLYIEEHRLNLHHFVLMPNHVHLLLRVTRAEALSKAMLGLNLTYALYYQRRYAYRGHLWQGRFKSLLIDRDSYLLACGRYIELNPVRAGLVEDPRLHVWGSYRFYAEGADNPLISAHPLYDTLGATPDERQKRYRQFVHEELTAPQPCRSLYRQRTIQQRDHPIRLLEERFGFPATRRGRGRPKKAWLPVQTGTATSPCDEK